MDKKRIHLRSGKDLLCLAEVFTAATEHGPYEFAFTNFAYIDDEHVAYYGESNIRKKMLSLQMREDLLQPIPDNEVYPEYAISITIASLPENEPVYIKRPKLSNYNDLKGTDTTAKLLLEEAEIMELIRDNPHPNIVKYHGCILKRGRIVGIALNKLYKTLFDRLEDQRRGLGKQGFDVNRCFNYIKSALDHLHSLGLAHNDICPNNVMIDENDNIFLIDFGSCRPFGCKLISGGTPGWMEEFFTPSERKHDEFSLVKLESWLFEMTNAQQLPN